MDKETVKQIWQDVTNGRLMSANKAALGDSYFYKGYHAKDRAEFANGISQNDPLNYMFEIDGDLYRETMLYLLIKPEPGSYLAYGRAKMRSATIKNITPEKLRKRFEKIEQFLQDNKENMKHD